MSATDGLNVQQVGEQTTGPFRDPDLTDEHAIEAMRLVTDVMVRTSLEQRHGLLDIGFASEHTFCRNLDRIAREMAEAHSVLRRMETQRRPFEKPSDDENGPEWRPMNPEDAR